jgi:hypothetical protein
VRNLALYEELIGRGIMEADERGGPIDHVTARRLAIWLLPRSREEPDFMRGLIRFAKTGAVTHDLKNQLRHQARSPNHSNRPYAARLLQYAVARGGHRGPIGENFGAVCDQIDQADALLADLRDRVVNTPSPRSRAHPEPSRPPFIAMVRRDPASRTVSFFLDEATASMAIHAITANAVDREAHTREVQRYGQALPADSYGRRNREVIAARETRIAARLRAIERAYRAAVDLEPTSAIEPSQRFPVADRTRDHEPELG